MQACDPLQHTSLDNPYPPDLSAAMSHNIDGSSSSSPDPQPPQNDIVVRSSGRPLRACTARAAARLYTAQQPAVDRKSSAKKERREESVDSPPPSPLQPIWNRKIVTPLVGISPPTESQLPRWNLRSMWELASVLHFLHVFSPLLNINVEFSAEEFETALLTPNNTLSDIHIPLLKAIPPVTRMALGRGTWVTVLCRKLRDWWHWVADGDIPIIASHGAEIDQYNALEPAVRVVILKALCDIRVEQEDIRNYIDNSIKHGVQLSAFRKERVGGDSQGISYWYEDDPIIGHRLYREIRKTEVKKVKAKGSQVLPSTTYHWETVATNLDEFQDVSEKLLPSQNRTEAFLGKKIKNDMLPEIEKVHKRKEKLLKKQHREALLLDNYINMDGLSPGRSLRDRKHVTYTFDDYDRSINEAIKITKRKQPSPEPITRREGARPDVSTNGRWSGSTQATLNATFSSLSPESPDYDEIDDLHNLEQLEQREQLDRSSRRRQRPQRYSEKEFVDALSDNEADVDSDDDIVGEAVYNDEYLRKRKQRQKLSSGSEGDDWDEEHGEDEEEEEEEEDEEEENSMSMSEDSDGPQRVKKLPGRTRRETKLRSVGELQSGLRRSNRATKNRIDYRQYEMSDSENETLKPEKSKVFLGNSDASDNLEYSRESQEPALDDGNQQMEIDKPSEECPKPIEHEQEQNKPPEKSNSSGQDEVEGVRERRFLDLNELAPGSGIDDGPDSIKDEDTDEF